MGGQDLVWDDVDWGRDLYRDILTRGLAGERRPISYLQITSVSVQKGGGLQIVWFTVGAIVLPGQALGPGPHQEKRQHRHHVPHHQDGDQCVQFSGRLKTDWRPSWDIGGNQSLVSNSGHQWNVHITDGINNSFVKLIQFVIQQSIIKAGF